MASKTAEWWDMIPSSILPKKEDSVGASSHIPVRQSIGSTVIPDVQPIGGPDKAQAPGGSPRPAGFTGLGVDGVAQPNMRVPQASTPTADRHESEFIFDAQATQAIGPDILEALRTKAASGAVDPNKLRMAIGDAPKPGFKAGGLDNTAAPTDEIQPIGALPKAAATAPTQDRVSTVDLLDPPAGGRQAGAAPRAVTGGQSVVYNQDGSQAGVTGSVAGSGADNFKATIQPIGGTPSVPPTAATPATPPPAPSGQQDINDATQYFRDVLSGNSPLVEAQWQRSVNMLNAQGGDTVAALKQELAASGMSQQGISAASAAAARDQSGAMAKLLGEVGADVLNQQDAAASTLNNIGVQERTYADGEFDRMSTDVESGMSLKAFKAKYPTATDADYASIQAKISTKTPEDVIKSFLVSGGSRADLYNNQTLRSKVAQALGVSATDPAVDAEIERMTDEVLNSNADVFGGRVDQLIQRQLDVNPGLSIDNLMDETSPGYSELILIAGYYLGVDANTPEGKAAIKTYLEGRLDYQGRSSVEQDIIDMDSDDFFDTWLPDSTKPITDPANAEFFAAMHEIFRTAKGDMYDAETGTFSPAGDFEFPWNTPSGFSGYNTYNNEDLGWNADENRPETIEDFFDDKIRVPGNEADGDYYVTSEDGTTRAVTNRDIHEKVQEMIANGLEDDLDQFYDEDGKFKAKEFLERYFNPSDPYGTEYGDSNQAYMSRWAKNINGERTAFSEDILANWDGTYEDGTTVGGLRYVNDLGQEDYFDIDSDQGQRIYMQMNSVFGGTDADYDKDGKLSLDEFKEVWNNGDGWYVAADGTIENLNPDLWGDDFPEDSPLDLRIDSPKDWLDRIATPMYSLSRISNAVDRQYRVGSGTLDNWNFVMNGSNFEVDGIGVMPIYSDATITKDGDYLVGNIEISSPGARTFADQYEGSVFNIGGEGYRVTGRTAANIAVGTAGVNGSGRSIVATAVIVTGADGKDYYWFPGLEIGEGLNRDNPTASQVGLISVPVPEEE